MSARTALFVILIAVMALAVPSFSAQTTPPQEPQADETASGGEAGAEAQKPSSEDRKQQRIEEYLRKREERSAQKELNRQNQQERQRETEAAKIESAQIAAEAAAAEAVLGADPLEEPMTEMTPAPTAKKKSKRRNAQRGSSLPRDLARAQDSVRMTALAQDPTVQEYLAMIDQQLASPHQLAAFGSFLAQNGMVREALAYYDVALNIDSSDPLLWINAGTLQLKTANLSAAVNHFSRALALDQNSAMAHYNLGSTLYEMDKYEDALLEYKIALGLDPSLGDPAQNPSAAHNDLLTAVKLMLYKEQTGSLSLPLLDVETGRPLSENRGAGSR